MRGGEVGCGYRAQKWAGAVCMDRPMLAALLRQALSSQTLPSACSEATATTSPFAVLYLTVKLSKAM